MKLLSTVGAEVEQRIGRQFPLLRQVVEKEGAVAMGRLAISVFDHWLQESREWHLMECHAGPERQARDEKFAAHWAAIFDLTPVYTVRYRGRWPTKARLVLKQYTDRAGYLERCRVYPLRAPKQLIVLPAFDCIYASSWDDTNVLYFNHLANAEPVVQLAREAGLFVLDFSD